MCNEFFSMVGFIATILAGAATIWFVIGMVEWLMWVNNELKLTIPDGFKLERDSRNNWYDILSKRLQSFTAEIGTRVDTISARREADIREIGRLGLSITELQKSLAARIHESEHRDSNLKECITNLFTLVSALEGRLNAKNK